MGDEKIFLYKYRSIDERNIDRSRRIFTHDELYFSYSNQFNDPFDCKFDFSFAANNQELKRYFRNSLRNKNPNWNRKETQRWIAQRLPNIHNPKFKKDLRLASEKTISEIGICSLSGVPDDILMWSHYADSHKGFCVKIFDDENDKFIVPIRLKQVSRLAVEGRRRAVGM